MSAFSGVQKTASQVTPAQAQKQAQQPELPQSYKSASGSRATYRARRRDSLLGAGIDPSTIQAPPRMATEAENQAFWRAFASGNLAEWEKNK